MVHSREDSTNVDTYFIQSKNVHYQGNWMGGLPHGRGIAIYPDGSYYYGLFDEGEAVDPNGCLILPNGAEYEGNIVNSKIEGRGILKHKLGYCYEGEWKNSRPHGEGVETY